MIFLNRDEQEILWIIKKCKKGITFRELIEKYTSLSRFDTTTMESNIIAMLQRLLLTGLLRKKGKEGNYIYKITTEGYAVLLQNMISRHSEEENVDTSLSVLIEKAILMGLIDEEEK